MSYKDKEKQREYNRQYRLANLEKEIERCQEYKQNNREKINERARQYRTNHLEEAKAKKRKWYRDNREYALEYNNSWNKNNPEKVRAAKHKRLQSNPQYKIACNLRRRINAVLKGISKSQSSMKLLGCDMSTFMKHIESQFVEGMNWDNYGYYGWHIDHIRPCVSFDLTKPEEQAKCFHYTNLQPLWAKDNLSKRATIPSR